MSAGWLTWPGHDLGVRTLEALQVPCTHARTMKYTLHTKPRTCTYYSGSETRSRAFITSSSRDSGIKPLSAVGEKMRDIERDWCTSWCWTEHKTQVSAVLGGGASLTYIWYTHITGPRESTRQTHTHIASFLSDLHSTVAMTVLPEWRNFKH